MQSEAAKMRHSMQDQIRKIKNDELRQRLLTGGHKMMDKMDWMSLVLVASSMMEIQSVLVRPGPGNNMVLDTVIRKVCS